LTLQFHLFCFPEIAGERILIMAKTVVGLFDALPHAEAAVTDLVNHGYRREDISLVANAAAKEYGTYFDEEGRYVERHENRDEMTSGEGAAAGAGIGATIGGIGGLLMGLGLLAIPGVGPALAAGPIVSTLVGAGIGAASGGVMGALVNNGIPEEHAGYYAEGVRRGGALIMVTVDDTEAQEVQNILNRHHPVDLESRVRDWREHGFEEYDRQADPYTTEDIHREQQAYHYAPTMTGLEGTGMMGTDMYRTHFNRTYGTEGKSFDTYHSAYELGAMLARESGHRASWSDIELEARTRWEADYHGHWEDYREAVRYGFEQEEAAYA
jgi:uncharacterized membrane protein